MEFGDEQKIRRRSDKKILNAQLDYNTIRFLFTIFPLFYYKLLWSGGELLKIWLLDNQLVDTFGR